MIDKIDLHFNLLAMLILYNDIWQTDDGIAKKKRMNEIMYVCAYAHASALFVNFRVALLLFILFFL